MALAIFMSNLAENYQPVIELYQSADHPALSPKSGGSEWRVAMAHLFGGFWSTTWKTRQKNPPIDWEVGEGGRYECGLAWLRPLSPQRNSSRSYYFALFFEVTWHLGHVIDVKHSL